MPIKYIKLTIVISVLISFSSFGQNISSLNPNKANQGDVLNVSISGQNTHFAQGSLTVWFNQGSSTISPYSVYPTSNTSIDAGFYIPNYAKTGYWHVNVDNTVDGLLVKNNGFLINSNEVLITDVTPDNANQGQTLNVSISGQNTHFTQGSETIWFSQGSSTTIYANTINASSDTLANANFNIPSNANTGYWDVNVNNPTDGHLTKPDGFFVSSNQAQLLIINPNTANRGTTLTVSISGQNTHFAQGSLTVWFNQGTSTITPNTISGSNSLLNAEFSIPPDAAIGDWDVNVDNTVDGHLKKFDGFRILWHLGMPDQSENQFNIEAYPNPTDGILYLKAKLDKPTTLQFSVINLIGKKVFSCKVENVSYLDKEIDLNPLPGGMYFIHIKSSDQEFIKKIVRN